MSNKSVIITAGSIPAKIDSVKFLGNAFKGRLMRQVADYLAHRGHNITVVMWKHNDKWDGYKTILVEDVIEYYEKVPQLKADAYILGAAVANLMLSIPWSGKFPSHEYEPGDKIPIKLEISPRTIDIIKARNPSACLIGYKLSDGTDKELVAAARKVLVKSKANAIFANHSNTAKERKILVTQDFTEIPMSFDEHLQTIYKLINLSYYRTYEYNYNVQLPTSAYKITSIYPTTIVDNRVFGTFAIRDGDGFYTTARGKRDSKVVKVFNVDHVNRWINASSKATMNAPLLDKIFELMPDINVILHNHIQLDRVPTYEYQFPGTTHEVYLAETAAASGVHMFNIRHHGYIAAFKTIEETIKWLKQ